MLNHGPNIWAQTEETGPHNERFLDACGLWAREHVLVHEGPPVQPDAVRIEGYESALSEMGDWIHLLLNRYRSWNHYGYSMGTVYPTIQSAQDFINQIERHARFRSGLAAFQGYNPMFDNARTRLFSLSQQYEDWWLRSRGTPSA